MRLFDGPGIQHLQARARSSRASATRANAEKQRRAKALRAGFAIGGVTSELPRRSGAQHNGRAAEGNAIAGVDALADTAAGTVAGSMNLKEHQRHARYMRTVTILMLSL